MLQRQTVFFGFWGINLSQNVSKFCHEIVTTFVKQSMICERYHVDRNIWLEFVQHNIPLNNTTWKFHHSDTIWANDDKQ